MLRRLSLALLLAALLLAQTLGQLHRFAHGSARVGPDVAVSAASAGFAETRVAAPLLQRLFLGHQQDADCRLYDQLATGDALTSSPVLALLLPLPALLIRFLTGLALMRHAALYEARGPPVSL